jgi:hypothetical protein
MCLKYFNNIIEFLCYNKKYKKLHATDITNDTYNNTETTYTFDSDIDSNSTNDSNFSFVDKDFVN